MTDHDHPQDDSCGCGHDHCADHDHDDEEMVEIVYTAREDVLEKLGISPEEFAEALDKAIDGLEELAMREDVKDEDIPAMEDLVLSIKGKEYPLHELAEITFDGEFDDEDGEELDEEEVEEVQED